MSRRVILTKPSALSGAARAFDMGATFNRRVRRVCFVRSPAEDYRVLARDYRVVAHDLSVVASWAVSQTPKRTGS